MGAGALVLVAALALAGCRVDTRVVIDVADNGGGTVTVDVALDADAVAQLGGAQRAAAVPLDDLRAAGWVISPVRPADDGGASIQLVHQFTDRADLARRLAEIFGSEGVVRDPRIERTRDWFASEDRASVLVDMGSLTAGVAGDAALRERLVAAGLDPDRLETELTGAARDAAQLKVTVRVPGGVEGTAEVFGLDDAPVTVQAASARSHSDRIPYLVAAGVVVVVGLVLLGLARRSARRARTSA